ncbi:TPA: Lar family restriction alleviation protein [Enterobacter hormaechei]|uniref:Lar family restriction alleviation protein n=1 Tax=Enterobacter hormaechei TaxID=158836 RepID=UPI0018C25091|nr:Lar family restriction alleviation protein [Enterobacter hormaechei]HCM9397663.1 Lar family restriction alleviation protein [Enterobacter hormaechei subsp. steigerwaltii]HCT5175360.1 Lar family restriction alleviation protein [Enterobacter hormaechei]
MIYDLKLPHWASLLNCTFCGGEAELVADGDGVYAGCATKQCLIKPITETYPTKRDAIRAWNRRPS